MFPHKPGDIPLDSPEFQTHETVNNLVYQVLVLPTC